MTTDPQTAQPNIPPLRSTKTPADAQTGGAMLVNVHVLTAMLGISRATIFSWHSQGRIPMPVALPGRVLRWDLGEIRSWLTAGCPNRAEWERMKKNTPGGHADEPRGASLGSFA